MFKAKKSEENQMPFTQDENYLKNNYFSRTFEENDSLKKEVIFPLIFQIKSTSLDIKI